MYYWIQVSSQRNFPSAAPSQLIIASRHLWIEGGNDAAVAYAKKLMYDKGGKSAYIELTGESWAPGDLVIDPRRFVKCISVDDDTLGGRIKAAREAAGITQQQLADTVASGVRQRVYEWENGTRSPRRETLEKIAAVLGVKAGWLMFGE